MVSTRVVWVLGKLGPSPILRQIGPHTFWCCGKLGPLMRQIGPRQIGPRQIGPRQIGPLANWAHLDKVLDFGVKLQSSLQFFVCRFDKP